MAQHCSRIEGAADVDTSSTSTAALCGKVNLIYLLDCVIDAVPFCGSHCDAFHTLDDPLLTSLMAKVCRSVCQSVDCCGRTTPRYAHVYVNTPAYLK